MVEEFKYSFAINQTPCSKECEKQEGDPALLSKWKESAARFQPSCKNLLPAEFSGRKNKITWKQLENIHDREVLDAAEALTRLSRSATNRT